MSQKKTFKGFQSLNEFLQGFNASAKELKIVLTTNGYQLLALRGQVVSTIHGALKGDTPQETAKNLVAVNLTFGIPHNGGLPCALENKSDWEIVDIF
jgi:hypothetical protein